MKELSIEEKAKRYDEAVERANAAHKDEDRHLKATLERIFPELKESEDERIKNELISYVQYLVSYYNECSPKYSKWLAWLEKQGEKDKEILILKDQIESLHAAIKALKETHRIELEKQDEKTSDKIVEKARTEKQKVLLTETDGSANIDWDCRSLDDVKILLKCGLEFIRTIEANKQILADTRFGGCSIRVPTRYDKGIKQNEQKPLWSEEDETMITLLHNIVDHHYSLDIIKKEEQLKLEGWLKSLKDRYTWKPSDEQMYNLSEAAHYSCAFFDMEILKGLYDDLMKLREVKLWHTT